MCFFIFTALVFFIETKLCALTFNRNDPALMKKSDDDDAVQCCPSSEIRESLEKISIVDNAVEGRLLGFRENWIFLLVLYYIKSRTITISGLAKSEAPCGARNALFRLPCLW